MLKGTKTVVTIFVLLGIQVAKGTVLELGHFKFKFDGNLDLSRTSTHSKAVMCLVDPYWMEETDLSVEEISVDLCTHIFIETRFRNNTLWDFEDLNNSSAPVQVRRFNERMAQHRNDVDKNCKLILSMNSYKGDTGTRLNEIMEGTKEVQLLFVNEVIQFLRKNEYNGVNIELSPNNRMIEMKRDQLYGFIKLFSDELKLISASLILTLHSPFIPVLANFEWNVLDRFFDFLLFRYRSTDTPKALGTNPLVALKGSHSSVESIVKLAAEKEIPREKIVIGIPTYNLEYNLIITDTIPHYGERFNLKSAHAPSYPDVCVEALSGKNKWRYYYDDLTETTFMTSGSRMIAFCSPLLIAKQAKFLMREKLGGLAIWGLLDEDYKGHYCDPETNVTYPILRTLNFVFSTGLEVDELKKLKISNSRNILWISIGVTSVAICAVLLCAISRKLAKKSKDILTLAEEEEFYAGAGSLLSNEIKEFYENIDDKSLNELIRYDTSLEIPETEFTIYKSSILGFGAFGTVYKGQLIHIGVVAVKTVNISPVSKEDVKSFLDEIRIMCYVGKHEHILALIGANTSRMRSGRVFAFVDFCEHGSLKKVLKGCKETFVDLLNGSKANKSETKIELSQNSPNSDEMEGVSNLNRICSRDLILWASQISKGMEYLGEKKVIHGDLATRNVLVQNRNCVKISDFGLSRKLYAYCVYKKTKQEPLPWRWMAVESLRDMEFSTKSDMWSYGVTLWEIFSLAELPYQEVPWSPKFVNLLIDGLRLQQPKYSSDEIYQEMEKCWLGNASQRPDFATMTKWFDGLHIQNSIYINKGTQAL